MTITILFILGIIIFLIATNLIMLLSMSFTFQQQAINSLYNEIKNAEPNELRLLDKNLSLWSNKQQDFLVLNGTLFYKDTPVLQVSNRYLPNWYMNTIYFYQYYEIKKFRKLLKTKFPTLIF